MIKKVFDIKTGEEKEVEVTPQDLQKTVAAGVIDAQKTAKRNIRDQIADLEAQQTPRRVREAILGVQKSIEKLQEIEEQITVLRALLKE